MDLLEELEGEFNKDEIDFHIEGRPHEYFEIQHNREIVFNRPWISTGERLPSEQFQYQIKACLKSQPKVCDLFSLTFEIVN